MNVLFPDKLGWSSIKSGLGLKSPNAEKKPAPLQGGNRLPEGYEQGQLQKFTPEQMQLFKSMFGQSGPDSYLSKLAGGDQELFNQMEAPAMRQFAQQQGDMASRFSGMGMGARNSSGFQNSMGQASSDFLQNMQSQRQQLQRQAIMDMMGISSNLLSQQPYEQFLTKKQAPAWHSLVSAGAPIAGAAVGGFFGGPAGAFGGAQLGSSFAQGITGQNGGQMNFQGSGDLPTKWG